MTVNMNAKNATKSLRFLNCFMPLKAITIQCSFANPVFKFNSIQSKR